MSNKQKKITAQDLEGSININDNKTPITHQPISEVRADLWHTMTISDLMEQRLVLSNRYLQAMSCNLDPTALRQMRAGIEVLVNMIDNHEEDTLT